MQNNLLVGDGALATQLYQLGVPVGSSYEELCLTSPRLVWEVHKTYYDAGARLLETNTFGANRDGLSRYGLENKVTRINRAAVTIAREAAEEDAFVVGSMGSVIAGRVRSKKIEIYRDQFEEQAVALLYEGLDGILLETFLDLDELLLALQVIRPLTNLPIIAQLALLEVGRTRDGYTLEKAFQQLKEAGSDVVGLNCRLGPAEILRSFESTVIPDGILLSAFPNAGRLGLTDGEYAYKSSPAYFGESALLLQKQGIQLIGGCCGTTPEHIKEIANSLKGRSPIERTNPSISAHEKETLILNTPQRHKPSILDLVKERHTIIVEFDPPKDLDTTQFLHGCNELSQAGADAITLADNSLANVRMSNMAMGAIMKSQFGLDPLLHIACRDRNLIGQQSHLMGLHAFGIDQILVITGDPSRFGDLPGASSVFDVSSFDLIRMVKQLNEGFSFSGRPLKQKAQFIVGAAFNPHVRHLEASIQRLEKKIEAGADYIMTQPVYDTKTIELIYESTKHLDTPIFIGIMPLTSLRNATFLHNEVPGIKLSQSALDRMGKAHEKDAQQEGIRIAQELIDTAVKHFRGIYLITPFNYYKMTVQLTHYIHEKTNQKELCSKKIMG